MSNLRFFITLVVLPLASIIVRANTVWFQSDSRADTVVSTIRAASDGRVMAYMSASAETANVPNGSYDIYFNYSTDTTGLYQGDKFTLQDNGVEITITKVVNGNYGIRKVK